MTIIDILAVLLALSALVGLLNHKLIGLPHTVGLVLIALVASGIIVAAEHFWPTLSIGPHVRDLLKAIDFQEVLLEGFLSALLFAGAVHVDLTELAERKWSIGLMATIGVLISTVFIGTLMWLIAPQFGLALPFLWALVFGALISPTDPVAVLGILKTVKLPRLLQAKIAGESLLNDGVGVVVFTILLTLAMASSGINGPHAAPDIGPEFIVTFLAKEVLGGAILGLICGLIAYWAMRSIDEHNIEVMITLALVTGAYALALKFHLSGPIAVVVAGLLIGNHGARFAMSENTRRHVFQFWELLDEILNSILFLLIGLELVLIGKQLDSFMLALVAIPVVLVGRLLAVSGPIGLLSLRENFEDGAIRILTWAGLRGGISVALALALPDSPYKPALLTATYAVVVFSILVQGLTTERLVRSIVRKAKQDPSRPLAATAEEITAAAKATAGEPDDMIPETLEDKGGKRARRRRKGKLKK